MAHGSKKGDAPDMGKILIALTLAACATPYQSSGFRGGYSEKRIGNRWLIRVEVNGFTSMETAIEYSYRRAEELCPGGFDVEDANRHATEHTYRDGYGNSHDYEKPSAMLVVVCRPVARQCGTPSC